MKKFFESISYFVDEILNPTGPCIVACKLPDLIAGEEFSVGFVHVKTLLKMRTEYESIENQIMNALATNSYNLIVAPEYSFSHGKPPFNEKEKDELVIRIADATKGKKTLVIPGTVVWHKQDLLYNTAYAIADGKVLCEYHKEDITTLEDELSNELEMGGFFTGKAPGLLQWNRLSVGIEICADACSLLKARKYCDLQILVSCGRCYTDECARYVIVNDGNTGELRLQKEKQVIFNREHK